MCILPSLLTALLWQMFAPLAPGDSARSIRIDGRDRIYLVHVPPSYDRHQPTPLVLALHPFGTDARRMIELSGLNETADRAGFVVAYPNGTGQGRMLRWNEGGILGSTVDDIAFLTRVLDDLASVTNVDPRRVYATGFSNGAMMCYRLASERSDRIAAIAPISGTMAVETCLARRPVPVLHFHGTKDTLVPYDGPGATTPKFIRFKSVEETMKTWAAVNGCPDRPARDHLPTNRTDDLPVQRWTFGPGRAGSEIVLYVIEGGGHTWPGRLPDLKWFGKAALGLPANELIWEFFRKHPMP